jgi:AAA+ superfamily predicted ATPase
LYEIGRFWGKTPSPVPNNHDDREQQMDLIADQIDLPNARAGEAWDAIKIPEQMRTRLEAQSLLALQLRQKFPFETLPVHGLLVLSGPPGTGKTTLARGLANKVAGALTGTKTTFVQIDTHALTSSALGRSQKEVAKLFSQTIPELAVGGVCIVLLDEVETLAPDRQRMSLEANPVDVHRATDAALAGLDLLTRKHRNVLLIATTNYPKAVDRALMSRADWIEHIDVPGAEARAEIIADTLDQLASAWPRVADLKRSIGSFVAASEGLDGRRIRKAIISAAASSVETARDPNKLKADHVLRTLKVSAKAAATQEAA